MPLTVVAELSAKPRSEELLRKLLKEIVGPVRAEEGCLQYDLHESTKEPGKFLFFENWKDGEALQRHGASAHMKEFGQKAGPFLGGGSKIVTYNKIA